jgi:16S rRNA (guanine527-N7)-methyltransferase
VETIADTLDRIRGCLATDGLAVFMKGPHCNEEIQAAQSPEFSDEYLLVRDEIYHIPNTPHERRLVVFRRSGRPLWAVKAEIMKRRLTRIIESEQNDLYKDLKKLLASHGIKKLGKAFIFGHRQIAEILRDFPQYCEAWVSSADEPPPPSNAPEHLAWYQLAPPLFKTLDVFGTHTPFLLVRAPEIEVWDPSSGLPSGCSVIVPFQDPENVGAIIRSAAAFGVHQVIVLSESAHPFHPKALRTSGGAAFRVKLLHGPPIASLPESLTLLPLSPEGRDIAEVVFPKSFGILPGLEGPGLPDAWRKHAVAVPIKPGVESLNAATATAIVLYIWSRSATR